ncbi:enoyl-CoA hydratase-related protein [Pseudohaliea sp.]|uniref:enoyl-CoA hydratase-related protein n=1 Tax=Pseudohaliea sp. TaxID=2740289 RepID=UPI0032ED560C
MPGNKFYEQRIDQQNYDHILLDKRPNGVLVATLNRPERLNAVNPPMHHEIVSLAREFDEDPTVKVLLLTGAGKSFCSGGDFSEGSPDDIPASRGRDPRAPFREGRRLIDDYMDCEKPIITAVKGYAMGMGATIALLGDIVIAGRSAVFADTHTRMGIAAGDGGQVLWPPAIGPYWARYFMMTGEKVTADLADRLGLVSMVVEDDDLHDRALEVANRLAEGPSMAIIASKLGVNRYLKDIAIKTNAYGIALEELTFHSEDASEAMSAFQEKRPPRFRGR